MRNLKSNVYDLFKSIKKEANIQKANLYIKKIILKQKRCGIIKLPSLLALTGHLKITEAEARQALEDLSQNGFDYMTIEKTLPIMLWDKFEKKINKLKHFQNQKVS